MLRASEVSYRYAARRLPPGRGTHDSFALRRVTATVARGAIVGLLGPNGCGKTTLTKLLSGVLLPDEGEVTLGEVPLRALSRRQVARHIAVVPQETHPAFDYTALEMVLMGRHPHLGAMQLEGPADLAIAHDAMLATGTADLAERRYMTLSGGEKQRVIIASALAQTPDVLLLDEPTASLDLGYQLEVAALLARLNRERGVTMILATHDLNLAARLCSELLLMRGGRVLAQGATRDVLTPVAIRQLYDVDAEVAWHPAAAQLTVTPLGRRR